MKTTFFNTEMVKEYELLCRDVVIAKFILERDSIVKCETKGNSDLLPMNFSIGSSEVALYKFLTDRHLDFNRTRGRELLRRLDLVRSKSICNVIKNKALSLTDCYWVREKGSREIFSRETLYYKKASQFIVDISLTGVSKLEGKFEPNAEITNIGSFDKAWKYVDNEWRLYKRGTVYNYYAELFYCHLAIHLEIPVALYKYDKEMGMIYSVNITNDSRMLEHASTIPAGLMDSRIAPDTKEDIHGSVQTMELLDAITYNYDRHEYNWGVLRNTRTGVVIGMSPIFDNNLCLGVDGDGNNTGPLGLSMLRQLDLTKEIIRLDITMEGIKDIDRKVKIEMGCTDLNTARQMEHMEKVLEYLEDIRRNNNY